MFWERGEVAATQFTEEYVLYASHAFKAEAAYASIWTLRRGLFWLWHWINTLDASHDVGSGS